MTAPHTDESLFFLYIPATVCRLFSGGLLLKHSGRVGEVCHFLYLLITKNPKLGVFFFFSLLPRRRCLVLVAGQNDWAVVAASLVVSQDRESSSYNHPWPRH